MSDRGRFHFAVYSYWFLFIIAPVVVVFELTKPKNAGFGWLCGLLVVLVVFGEYGFRPWKRLWKVR